MNVWKLRKHIQVIESDIVYRQLLDYSGASWGAWCERHTEYINPRGGWKAQQYVNFAGGAGEDLFPPFLINVHLDLNQSIH